VGVGVARGVLQGHVATGGRDRAERRGGGPEGRGVLEEVADNRGPAARGRGDVALVDRLAGRGRQRRGRGGLPAAPLFGGVGLGAGVLAPGRVVRVRVHRLRAAGVTARIYVGGAQQAAKLHRARQVGDDGQVHGAVGGRRGRADAERAQGGRPRGG